MKSLSSKLLIIFSMFSAACFLPRRTYLFSDSCITEEPSKSEVAGTYVADELTLKYMETHGQYNPAIIPKLILHEDGKLDVMNMPDWWSSGGESNRSVEPPSSGTWQFYSNEHACREIFLDLPSMTPNMNLFKSRFGQNPKYIMTRSIGDPDSGNLMVFVKE